MQKSVHYIFDRLSKMICGDSPYNNCFPYRSSSQLTSFFLDINLPYKHDGSSRAKWVLEVLNDINKNHSQDNVLTDKIVKVIKYLLDTEHFKLAFNEAPNFIYETKQEAKEKHQLAVYEINEVLKHIQFNIIANYEKNHLELNCMDSVYVTSAINERKAIKKITFYPSVFEVPEKEPNQNLIAVMMPFSQEFNVVYKFIQNSCKNCNIECKRVDEIWNNSKIVQDIFELIYISKIVISDFTGKNPNVMYETGIAHTLGKHVIPITQNKEHVPFDLKHHRYINYYPNKKGLKDLEEKLSLRIETCSKEKGK